MRNTLFIFFVVATMLEAPRAIAYPLPIHRTGSI